jgi:hypothetical protein
MSGGKKYLIRPDIGWFSEVDLGLLEVLRPHLDQAGIPYEVRDNPPAEGGDNPSAEEGESTRRRRSS